MTKEELRKATGKELIEQRDYCGVDGYYGDYLNDVNAEMLKRFNRLAVLEKENARLKKESVENQDLATIAYMQGASKSKVKLDEAKEIIQELVHEISVFYIATDRIVISPTVKQAEQFLKEVSE